MIPADHVEGLHRGTTMTPPLLLDIPLPTLQTKTKIRRGGDETAEDGMSSTALESQFTQSEIGFTTQRSTKMDHSIA